VVGVVCDRYFTYYFVSGSSSSSISSSSCIDGCDTVVAVTRLHSSSMVSDGVSEG
jgi:hypothetical protein